jgi:phosphohistidine phosphatase
MRTLHLLRHAKSTRDGDAGDAERPLAPRGVRAAALVGLHLAQEGLVPDLVLCSSARRAVETWQRAAAQLPCAPRVRREDALYLAAPEALLARVQRVDDAVRSLLLVGHNPGLLELATALASGDADAVRSLGKFPTAALASFALARGGWRALEPGRVSLVRFVRPADLV